jgi:hypothetical protein
MFAEVGIQLASALCYLDIDLQSDGPKQTIRVVIEQHFSIGKYPTTICASITQVKDWPPVFGS